MIEEVLEEVRLERVLQDDKWGWPRRHSPEWWLTIMTEEVGEFAEDILEGHFTDGRYRHNMRNELIQIAAVAVAAIEDLDMQDDPQDEW